MARRILTTVVILAALIVLLPAAPAGADGPQAVVGPARLAITGQTATSVTFVFTFEPPTFGQWPPGMFEPTLTKVTVWCETDRGILLSASTEADARPSIGLSTTVTGRAASEPLRCDARGYFTFRSATGTPSGWTTQTAVLDTPSSSVYPPRMTLDTTTTTTATLTVQRSPGDVTPATSAEVECLPTPDTLETVSTSGAFGTMILTGLTPGATYACRGRSRTAGAVSLWRSGPSITVPAPSTRTPPRITASRSSTHVRFVLALKEPASGWGVAKPTVVGAERECWLEGRWLPDRVNGDTVTMTGIVTSARGGRALVNCYQLRLVLRAADGSTVKTDFATSVAPVTARDPDEAGSPKLRQGARGRVLLQATKYGGGIRARCWPASTPDPASPDELPATAPDVSGEAWDHDTADQRVFTLATAPNTTYRCGYWIITNDLPDTASPVVEIRTGPAASDWSVAGFTAANGVINVDIAAVRGSTALPDSVTVTCSRSGRADVSTTGIIPAGGGRITVSVLRLDPAASYTCTAAARWSTYTTEAIPVSRQTITPAPSRTDILTLTPVSRGRLQAALWPRDGDKWRVACWPAANQSGDVERLGALPVGAMTSAPTTDASIRVPTEASTTYRCGAWKTSGDDDYRDTALVTVTTGPMASGITFTDTSADGALAIRLTSIKSADNLPTEVKVTCPGRYGPTDQWSTPVAGSPDTLMFSDLPPLWSRNPYLTYTCIIVQFVGQSQVSRQEMTLAPAPAPIGIDVGPTFIRDADAAIRIRPWTLTSRGRHSAGGLVVDAECSVMTAGRQDTVTVRSWSPSSGNSGLTFSWAGMATAFPYSSYRCRARVIDMSLPVTSLGYAGLWSEWTEVRGVSGRSVLVESAEITIAPGAVKGARITLQNPNAMGATYVDHLGQAICTPSSGSAIDTGWVPMVRVLDQYTFNGSPYVDRFPASAKERLAINVPELKAGVAYSCTVRLTRPRGYSLADAAPAFAGAWASVATFTRQKPGAALTWTKVVNALNQPISYAGGGYGWWVTFPRTPGVPRMSHQIQCRANESQPWTDGNERTGLGGELVRGTQDVYAVELIHQKVFGAGTWQCRVRAYFSGVDIIADPLAVSEWVSSGKLTYP